MLQGHFLNINAEDEPCLRPPWQVWPPELRVAVKERAALELAKRSLVVSWGAKHFRNAADMLWATRIGGIVDPSSDAAGQHLLVSE